MLNDSDTQTVLTRCGTIGALAYHPPATDLISLLLDTVLSFRLRPTTVRRAVGHYHMNCWNEIRTLGDLERLLDDFPDDRAGNSGLAKHLWGYQLWDRVDRLRSLVSFLRERRIDTLESFRAWAATSSYEDDFSGLIYGLGRYVYARLMKELGVETVMASPHLRRFVESTVGHRVSDGDITQVMRAAAWQLGCPTYDLDAAIFDWDRNGLSRAPVRGCITGAHEMDPALGPFTTART
jgi:hypothetical protein